MPIHNEALSRALGELTELAAKKSAENLGHLAVRINILLDVIEKRIAKLGGNGVDKVRLQMAQR